ncbi:MAG: acyl-CoA thioesterase [Gammaproteobacteria bacterium]|nr:acyl-CoA thioesterase [Gammaproteobacteria bacterium]
MQKKVQPNPKGGIRPPVPWRDMEYAHATFADPWIYEVVVGWGHCDPAQIVYTGNIPAWGIEAVEGWYRYCLGADWSEMNLKYGIGTPFAALEFDFKSPVRAGLTLQIHVGVSRIGNTSLTNHITASQNGELCFTGKTTAVFVESLTMLPLSIPPNIRKSIEAYQSKQG